MQRPIVIHLDESPLLRWQSFFLWVAFHVSNAGPDLLRCEEQHGVRSRGDHGMIRTHLIGEAKAQALADTFCKIVPLLKRFVFVCADHEMEMIAADGAGVARVTLLLNDLCDGASDFLPLGFIDPEDGKVQQFTMLLMKRSQFIPFWLLMVGFAA